MFKDRSDAARQLAQQLKRYTGQNPLVLAIPRGAAPMGKIIATALQGQLDVVLVHKLCSPLMPEVAIGAIDESGRAWLAPHAAAMGATAAYVKAEEEKQLQVLQSRRQRYTAVHPPINVRDRVVIVVDDGLATGATMMAALTTLRRHHPARLVCAVPVASKDTLEKIRPLADEVVCLSAPPDFEAVGQYYQHFPQVQDDEVVAILREGPL